MRNFITLFFICILSNLVLANEPIKNIESSHLKEVFDAWDANVGDYVYESSMALVNNRSMPEPNANVDKSVFEYLRSMPEDRINRINRIVETQKEISRENGDDEMAENWEKYERFIQSSRCDMNKGRSNGDPHMTTLDGKKYDFQNAGDYILTQNGERFQIQTRQTRHNEKISVNGAMVMDINGDVFEAYVQGEESQGDGISMMLNNEPVSIGDNPMVLKNGGVLSKVGKKYKVDFPTGEQVQFSNRTFQKSALLDIDVFVPNCREGYDGLLGNNDGNPNNDIVIRTPLENDTSNNRTWANNTHDDVFGNNRRNDDVRQRQQSDLRFISEEFGPQFLTNEDNNLFSNPWLNLPPYVMFPQEHLTLAELDDKQIEEGLKTCREKGVDEADLMGCVYDHGYVGLEPELPADYVDVNDRNQDAKKPVNNNKQVNPNPHQNTRVPAPVVRPRYPRSRRIFRPAPPVQSTPNTPRTPTSTPNRTPSNRGGNVQRGSTRGGR